MTPEEIYEEKVNQLEEKKGKLMQKVILLVDKVDKIDTKLEKLEQAEVTRIGLIHVNNVVNEIRGDMNFPDIKNLN